METKQRRLDSVAEATSLGAAIAGGVRVGLFPDFSVAHELVQVEEAEQPNGAAQALYAELNPLFQEAYQVLEPMFERLGKMQEHGSLGFRVVLLLKGDDSPRI